MQFPSTLEQLIHREKQSKTLEIQQRHKEKDRQQLQFLSSIGRLIKHLIPTVNYAKLTFNDPQRIINAQEPKLRIFFGAKSLPYNEYIIPLSFSG